MAETTVSNLAVLKAACWVARTVLQKAGHWGVKKAASSVYWRVARWGEMRAGSKGVYWVANLASRSVGAKAD